ncbi:hypothetical protein E4T38_08925 [Aureobasidium subglaciale]|nr:hypothetical protein E4T38_08925 [Aureobasidium subglaciale]
MYGQETHVFDAGPLGILEGLVLTFDNVPALHYFGDLPYALPPTGPHRFRLPRKLPSDYDYAYRLNALGFVTGKAFAAEASDGGGTQYGNMGFWDQRMALEWTHQNIAHFGGNPDNITCAGYSAGAYSTFHQLAHELYYVAAEKSLIKRIIMLSNGPADLDDATKLAKLHLFAQINNGDFARRMKERGMTLLSGECRDEHIIYRNWRTPGNSFDSVYARFCAEYPRTDVDKLLHHYCGSQQKLPAHCADWQELFGRVYADLQVHHMQRGFFNALFNGGLIPGKNVLRYGFDRRLKCVDATIPVEWGVTHSSDVPIWLWGSDFPGGLTDQERVWLRSWNEEFAAFVSADTFKFMIRGVTHQVCENRHPMSDDFLPRLHRDIELFEELGLNMLFVFKADNMKSHD